MTKKNLKELVKNIERLAQAAPPPPSGAFLDPNAPAPSGGSGDVPSGRGLNTRSTDIVTMQQALQDLAKDVTSQINLQDVASGDPTREKEAKERDAFGVFLTKNYMRNTKVPGVEYDPNPKITSVDQKRPDDPTRMSVVMDTMNRVGNPQKGENFTDGVWGPRTNAAIRDAYAFASGLLDFIDDMNRFLPPDKKMNITSYTRTNLQELEPGAQVDPNALSPQDKVRAAPIITQHIQHIKQMYDDVKKNVLQRPAFQQYIEGDSSFKSYYKVSPQQIALLKKQFPDGIDVKFQNFAAKIPIDQLISLDKLKEWMQQVAPSAVNDGSLTPETVVSAVWNTQKQLLGEEQVA
jgi:hypothetical protein